MPVNDPFAHLASQLAQFASTGRLRELVPRTIRGAKILLSDGRELINFGGNDYLGIGWQAPLGSESSVARTRGSGASPLLCGWTDLHQRLSESLACFEATEAAALFPSGFAACSGTVATLPQAGDLIMSDQLNHASLIDGCRLSRAECIVYRHLDCDDLNTTLSRVRDRYRHVWLVTDGVFSMDGHVAPLRRLCEIAERFDGRLIVDEAHATGVLGATGSGLCEELGVKDRVPIRIGTLSKAIGSQGGFVAGPRVVIDFLVNRCRSLVYSTALSPASAAAASHALEFIRLHPEIRTRLGDLARRVRSELSIPAEPPEAGIPIIPLIVGDDMLARDASISLAESGFYVPAIRPPTVPEGAARLRVSLSALHDDSMIEGLLAQLRRLRLTT